VCYTPLQAFRNPAEFTVVLTGAISEDVLLPLVERYLASIPAVDQPRPLQPRDITPLPFSFPQRPLEADVKCEFDLHVQTLDTPQSDHAARSHVAASVLLERPLAVDVSRASDSGPVPRRGPMDGVSLSKSLLSPGLACCAQGQHDQRNYTDADHLPGSDPARGCPPGALCRSIASLCCCTPHNRAARGRIVKRQQIRDELLQSPSQL
jgi:hypothetical protein